MSANISRFDLAAQVRALGADSLLPPTRKEKNRLKQISELRPGERVCIVGDHPWRGVAGELMRFETINGEPMWRIALDHGTECYARVCHIRRWPK